MAPGTIVTYNLKPEEHDYTNPEHGLSQEDKNRAHQRFNGATTLPAIVTQLFGSDTANIAVFCVNGEIMPVYSCQRNTATATPTPRSWQD